MNERMKERERGSFSKRIELRAAPKFIDPINSPLPRPPVLSFINPDLTYLFREKHLPVSVLLILCCPPNDARGVGSTSLNPSNAKPRRDYV